MLISIVIIFVLLMLAALTAASEIAIIAVSRIKLRKLASSGSRSARILLKMLEAPEKFFSTILVLNNIIDTLIAAIVTVMMVALAGENNKGIILATIMASLAIIVFEVVAKTLAATHSERLSLILARPVNAVISLCAPIVRGLVHLTNFVLRLVSNRVPVKPTLITDEELRALIKITAEENAVHKEKYRMLSKVFDFSDAVVKDVMTPKKDMAAIDINAPFEEILEKVLESGYSRLPVYKDSPDNIIGIINMKDLLNLSVNKELVVLHDIIYPAVFFPDTKKVSELLKEFQKGHTHLALVTDPNSRLEGLVTLEDLVEEIVGEIEDEYDVRAGI
ncbi:MAG: hemolysin family protein [Candidatus Omnitrophota bacterium]